MIDGFGFGLLLAFAFVGFISLIYNIILFCFQFEFTGRVIINVTNEMSKDDICNQLFGIDIRKNIYDNGIFNEVVVIDYLTDEDKKEFLSNLCANFCGITLIDDSDIQTFFDYKGV
ncbi:MAG: hypothetical protein UH249_06105 [Acutalibacteraceae bacterium]|nr:hypothetical protein [Acutalibacteraceae bacterium]